MARPQCERSERVSAAKTPTAEPVREGLWSRRDERTERGGPSHLRSNSVRSTREGPEGSAVGVDPWQRPGATPTRTACRVGGLSEKYAVSGTFWAMASPSKAYLPAQAEGSMPEV